MTKDTMAALEKFPPQQGSREALIHRLDTCTDQVVSTCQKLIQTPSENPPGDTSKVAQLAAGILGEIKGADVALVTGREPFVNVVARIKGAASGRRLILNGHLDTFPIGDRSLWTVEPLGALVRDGRLYGRGAADMKGGIAASMVAFATLAQFRDAWDGELVLTLAADEETMGTWGSAYMLKTIPEARGDAMICGDAGSPQVIRFGEKGLLWLELKARGRASHGAHVHLGQNALDHLVQAVLKIQSLAHIPVDTPEAVSRAIERARTVSESLAGDGETRVLTSITVNLGFLQGGTSLNLVPAEASAALDIRLPVGTTVDDLIDEISELMRPLPDVEFRVLVRHEPTFSDPDADLFKLLVKNGTESTGVEPVVNMRVGASDTRIFRSEGIPSAVYGCTPHNMGAPDEYVTVADLNTVFRVHTLTAFDYLSAERRAE